LPGIRAAVLRDPSLALEVFCADPLAAVTPFAGLPPIIGHPRFDQQFLEFGMGTEAGTIRRHRAAGVGLRFGDALGSTLPMATFYPNRQVNLLTTRNGFNGYVFLNAIGQFVANDIGVNRNALVDSHSMQLEHWQAQVCAGTALSYGRWGLVMSVVGGTDRVDGQPAPEKFGSLNQNPGVRRQVIHNTAYISAQASAHSAAANLRRLP
jgi:hypothetical protein